MLLEFPGWHSPQVNMLVLAFPLAALTPKSKKPAHKSSKPGSCRRSYCLWVSLSRIATRSLSGTASPWQWPLPISSHFHRCLFSRQPFSRLAERQSKVPERPHVTDFQGIVTSPMRSVLTIRLSPSFLTTFPVTRSPLFKLTDRPAATRGGWQTKPRWRYLFAPT